MRLQLLSGFALIIAVVVGITWLLAIRTTNAEFAVLISGANQQQARLLAPSLLAEYAATGNWSKVQENLTAQIERQNALAIEAAPYYVANRGNRGGVISLNFGDQEDRLRWNLDLEIPPEVIAMLQNNSHFLQPATPPSEGFFVVRPNAAPFFVEPPSIGWTVGNIILGNQRAIVVDQNDLVVVDTEKGLLGKRVSGNFTRDGVPLYQDSTLIGTLLIMPRGGVYTVEQTSFLQAVRKGFLYSGLLSAAIALLLALGLAHQITRPIRSLITATARLQAGEWGYQVDFKADNEIGQLAEAFNQMSSHLEEQRSLRTRLVDDLAHELNTPLSLMRLEVQAMADGFQTPAEAAQHLTQELGEVTDLVADLIFLASRDTTRKPEMDWVDLNALAASVMRRFDGTPSQDKRLIFTPAEPLPLIYGDSYLVQRAITNLLSNAIRHTPPGGQIHVRTAQHNGQIELSVQDTGEGIPAEHLPHIFERFYRVDDSRTRQSGGRGLGLAIVKQIMDQHEGEVQAHSELGVGSTFTLRWHTKT